MPRRNRNAGAPPFRPFDPERMEQMGLACDELLRLLKRAPTTHQANVVTEGPGTMANRRVGAADFDEDGPSVWRD